MDRCLYFRKKSETEDGAALSQSITLNGKLPKELNWPLCCILVIKMASNCVNRIKDVGDATVMEFVPRVSPPYLNFTVSDIFSSLGEWC